MASAQSVLVEMSSPRGPQAAKRAGDSLLYGLYLQWQRMMRATISTLFNAHVIFVAAVAVTSVYLCDNVLNREGKPPGIRYRVDTTFISVGAIFPLIFSIQAAFNRREAAAAAMARLKSACFMLYVIHRDWNRPAPGDMSTLGRNDAVSAVEARQLLYVFLKAVRGYLLGVSDTHSYESYAEKRFQHTSFWGTWLSMIFRNKVQFREAMADTLYAEDESLRLSYDAINRLSSLNEKTLLRWGYTKPGEAPTSSRLSTTLGSIMENFEALRIMKDYRTPVMLRYGNRVLILICAVMLGPYFNTFCWDSNLRNKLPGTENGCSINYIVALLFVITVCLLNQIARDIEYPFDMEGMDDLFFELASELREYAHLQVPPHTELLRADTLTKMGSNAL